MISLWHAALGTRVIMRVLETEVETSLSSRFLEKRRVKAMPRGRNSAARVTCTHIQWDLEAAGGEEAGGCRELHNEHCID